MMEMMIAKEGQLLVVIPCEFVSHRAPSEDGWSHSRPCADHQSTTDNMTETDLEAAQQLLQLSSQSLESTEAVEDGEDASSCLLKRKFVSDADAAVAANGRNAPRKTASKGAAAADGPGGRGEFTARDTADGVDGGARRRYKPIAHIYDVTSPTAFRAGGASRRSVKRRKVLAFS